ncbi:MAG: hypothetical protein MI922_02975 [Bacteroidales bacterium]|nr:hypothetical protein [Bacteroidales bacterium]
MKTINWFITISLVVCVISCEKEGINGVNSLVNILPEPIGKNCEVGGIRVESGLDQNGDGVLDEDEVQERRYVCNGTSGWLDKRIIIDFPADGSAYTEISTTGRILDFQVIFDFNINDYAGADSIVFGAYLKSSDSRSNCIAELYNRTHLYAIDNAIIDTNSLEFQWVESKINFIDDLPGQAFDMGIRLRTELQNTTVSMYLPSIIIYRK